MRRAAGRPVAAIDPGRRMALCGRVLTRKRGAPRNCGYMNAADETYFQRLLGQFAPSIAGLPDKPEETPEGTLRALWLTAAGVPCSIEAAADVDLPALDAAGRAALDGLMARRIAGTPLAHLTGRQRFMGLELLASADALVPRAETNLLGQLALGKIEGVPAARVIDLCTGSGNLAVALAQLAPDCTVAAADLSREAVMLARRNAVLTGVEDRVTFHVGDLFDALPRDGSAGRADLIVCNPPYISSAKVETMPDEISRFEPRLAFDGGAFGLTIVSRLLKDAPAFLKPGAWLCFEIGKGQGPYWQKALGRMASYGAVEAAADADGDIRALAARAV